MAYTTINKSTDYFNTKLYTGNNGTQSITGVGHQPDLIWVKARNDTANHTLTDAVRGTNSVLYSNQTQAPDTPTNAITSFNSDGFSVGSNGSFNANSINYASWNWKAGTGQGSSNTDGSINTTYTSVNTTAGFSISSYTGTGSAATVGHGLGAVPNVIIIKRLDQASNWCVYHTGLGGADHNVFLNTTSSIQTDTAIWNNTLPTTSVFSLGANADANGSGAGHIAYCFAEKTGYSKFGSYTGNGNADGTFVYLGFKPAFFITKNTTTGSSSWMLYDNKRDPDNQMAEYLYPNTNAAAGTSSSGFDFLSNGIKIRNTFGDANVNGNTFIYMAFAEAPLVGTNNIPATAR